MSRRDVAASVRQRLLNQSKSEGRPFQELLQYYAMERFLYRLAISPHADRFILKGALLLAAWQAPQSRPTVDIDLEGRLSNDLEVIRQVIKDVCQIESIPDGIHFEATTLEIKRITEDAEYEGLRARFDGSLAKARIRMQLDVAFGDVIVPKPSRLEYQPIGLTESFGRDPAKLKQWAAFRGVHQSVTLPAEFQELVRSIADFCLPVLSSINRKAEFRQSWKPGGPWKAIRK